MRGETYPAPTLRLEVERSPVAEVERRESGPVLEVQEVAGRFAVVRVCGGVAAIVRWLD